MQRPDNIYPGDHYHDGTSLRRTLGERHANMIAFSTLVGIGLFLQNGRIIHLAGPGMAWLSFLLTGSILWSVLAALGEMTALFPVPGAFFQLPCRFLDLSIGYAIGWTSWFASAVVIAAELAAVANLFKFEFSPADLERLHYPQKTLGWSTTGTNSAVWVTLFLFTIVGINLLRVRWYGEIEYFTGVLKLLFLIGLILFNIIINVQTGTHFRFYQDPWGFISRSFTLPTGEVITGGKADLAGVWSAMTISIFSMNSIIIVSVTAAENKNFRRLEGVKISSRKLMIRILILYTFATFAVGLNVPNDEPLLAGQNTTAGRSGTHSAFILAAVIAHKRFWPGFFNGFFIFSATSAGINTLYLSSRILHAMALSNEAWPPWGLVEKFRQRLTETGSQGVPRNAVFASSLFGLLGYLAVGSSPQTQLSRLALNATVSALIVFAVISVTFIRYKDILHHAAGENSQRRRYVDRNYVDRDQDMTAYSRLKTNPSYPYRSHGQPLRSYYALAGCIIMATFNGWRSLHPFNAGDFVASYISIIIFLALWLIYRFALHRRAFFRWKLYPSMNLFYPVMVDTEDRFYGRDRLRFDDDDGWWDRIRKFWRWIRVWLK